MKTSSKDNLNHFIRRMVALVVLPVVILSLANQSGIAQCNCNAHGCGIGLAFENGSPVNGNVVPQGTKIRAFVAVNAGTCPVPGGVLCPLQHGSVTLVHPNGFKETITIDCGLVTDGNPQNFPSTILDEMQVANGPNG